MTLYLNDLGLLCALGNSKAEVLKRLLAGDRSGLVASDESGLAVLSALLLPICRKSPPAPLFEKGEGVSNFPRTPLYYQAGLSPL